MDSFIQFLDSNKNASESVEPNSSKWMAGLKWVLQMYAMGLDSDPSHMVTTFQCNGEEERKVVDGFVEITKFQEFNDKVREEYETYLEGGGERSEEWFRDMRIRSISYTASLAMLLERAGSDKENKEDGEHNEKGSANANAVPAN